MCFVLVGVTGCVFLLFEYVCYRLCAGCRLAVDCSSLVCIGASLCVFDCQWFCCCYVCGSVCYVLSIGCVWSLSVALLVLHCVSAVVLFGSMSY